MRLQRKIPAIIGMALIACSFLIVLVHWQWPQRFDSFVQPFLPWRVGIGLNLPTVVLAVGVVLLLVASTGGSNERK
jgi:hypothetical protein